MKKFNENILKFICLISILLNVFTISNSVKISRDLEKEKAITYLLEHPIQGDDVLQFCKSKSSDIPQCLIKKALEIADK